MWIGENALMLPSNRGTAESIIYQTNVGEDTATVSMVEGEMYPILLSFTENVAGAWFQFTWQGGAQTSYTYDLTQHFYYYADEANFSPAHIPVNSIEPIILEGNKMYVGSYNGVSIWNDILTVDTTDYTDWKQAVAADSHVVASLSLAFAQYWRSSRGPASCIPSSIATFSFSESKPSAYSIFECS